MGSAALAGPNAGGTLVLALSEGTVYTTDVPSYCGSTTASSCDDVVATSNVTDDNSVLNVLAAFPPPGGRLAGITWGILYDEANVFLNAFGSCGDFEIADPDWPADGSGTAVTWGTAETGQLIEVYWFAGYGYAGFSLALAPHPTQGGNFADDSIPAESDPIAGFGRFGWGIPGSTPCPSTQPQTEACCFPDGHCQDLLPQDCIAQGGIPQGQGTACAGIQCPPPPPQGACCVDGVCIITTRTGCDAQGGVYQGDGTDCGPPDPCQPTPVKDSTWGSLKSNYR
jgi:hypothetical protein